MLVFESLSIVLSAALIAAALVLLRLRRRLEQQEATLAAFDEFSNDWAWEQDSSFRFTRFHGGAYRRQPLDLTPLLGRARWELEHSTVEPEAMAAHRAACENHEPFHDFKFGLRLSDGSVHWFRSSGYPVFDPAGRFFGYRGLAHEDRARTETERALRRSERRLTAIAEGSPVPMFALDTDGRVILWNRGCELVLGIAASEMLGRSDVWRAFYAAPRPVLATCVMSENADVMAASLYGELLNRSVSIPGALEVEGFFPQLAGRDRWLYFVAAPMRDDDGRIIGAIETLQDVTERRANERLLEQQRAELEAAQRIARVGSWRWPVGAARPECSTQMLALMRVGKTEPIPPLATFVRRVARDERREAIAAVRALLDRGEELDLVCRFGRRPGSTIFMHMIAHAERGPSGEITGYTGTTQDVSEERRIRQQIEALNASLEARVVERTAELRAAHDNLAQAMNKLVQSEKLASLGGLVAGVAHELNTPLGNAVTVATSLRERVEGFGSAARSGQLRRSQLDEFAGACIEACNLLERNVHRAAEQIAQFKQVAVDQTSERRRPFELGETIREIEAALRPRLRHRIQRLCCEVSGEIVMDSYPGPLEQVITNLVDNALNHAFANDQAGEIRIFAEPRGRDQVRIVVGDDGAGMSAEVSAHAFDPFFTTALGKGGSGLGLYIVYNLVSGVLGGTIRVDSEPGRGSRFSLELPLRAPEAGSPAAA